MIYSTLWAALLCSAPKSIIALHSRRTVGRLHHCAVFTLLDQTNRPYASVATRIQACMSLLVIRSICALHLPAIGYGGICLSLVTVHWIAAPTCQAFPRAEVLQPSLRGHDCYMGIAGALTGAFIHQSAGSLGHLCHVAPQSCCNKPAYVKSLVELQACIGNKTR